MKKLYLYILGVIFGEALWITCMHLYILSRCCQWEEVQRMSAESAKTITEDMKCFPIPLPYRDEIYYEDTYGASRENGGHEGCDIMDSEDAAGRIPIVSATDGVVTNVGWLYLGGYRIGITSPHDIYYYYAHLDSYAAGIQVGKDVKAGELLGFMGNTGEGEEGTRGKFPVHLHFGIFLSDRNGKEETVNSYPFLQKIDEE